VFLDLLEIFGYFLSSLLIGVNCPSMAFV